MVRLDERTGRNIRFTASRRHRRGHDPDDEGDPHAHQSRWRHRPQCPDNNEANSETMFSDSPKASIKATVANIAVGMPMVTQKAVRTDQEQQGDHDHQARTVFNQNP